MACTGIEFCKLAIVETKERAIRLVDDLEKRLADVYPGAPISIHLNGCPNACARTQVADIGLKGQIVTDAEGNQVEGFQVHLGGGLGLDAGLRAQAPRAQGHQRRAGRIRRARRAALRRAAHRGRALRAVGGPRRGNDLMTRDGNTADHYSHGPEAVMSERAVPFYCPYCGDEDLRPAEVAHGAWYCAACLRDVHAEDDRDRGAES